MEQRMITTLAENLGSGVGGVRLNSSVPWSGLRLESRPLGQTP